MFYDKFETVRLWGKHLVEELQSVYEGRASLAVMFISTDYVEKMWPRHERRAILSRAVEERGAYVLPVRFDDLEVPGLSRDLDYIRAENHSPAELAAMIAEKLGIEPFQGKASDVPPPQMTSLSGEAVFNYANHNGRYVIGRGSWSSKRSGPKRPTPPIHVYNDPPSIYGVALGRRDWTDIDQVTNAASLDYTSCARTPLVGQIVVFRNVSGFYAAVHVLEIKDDTRGDDSDELWFRYAIQPDGSDHLAMLRTV